MMFKKLKENDWINKYIWHIKPRKKFYTMEEEYEYAFLEDICHTIKCRLSRIWDFPGDKLRELKWYHQRGIRGYSDRDVWGFDYYLSDVIIGGLKKLKKDKQGCPCLDGFGTDSPQDQTDDQFESMQKEWDRRLDCIIFTFEITKQIQDNDLIVPHNDNNDYYFTDDELKKQLDFCEKVNKPHTMFGKEFTGNFRVISKEDWVKYNKGFHYLKKHYFGLWD